MDAPVDIQFRCQTCSQAISLDPGFSNMSDITYAELTLATHPPLSLDFEGFSLDKTVPSFQDQSVRQSHGFTVVGDFCKTTAAQVHLDLFNIMSGNSDIDYPLCQECTENLLGMLDDGNSKLQKDLSSIRNYLEMRQTEKIDIQRKEEELSKLKEEENRLRLELEEIAAEQAEADQILQTCEEEKQKLLQDEDIYWNSFITYKTQQFTKDVQRKSYRHRSKVVSAQLKYLEGKNVFSMCFNMWPACHFASINELRLGTLPSVPVEWSEINAALGQVALALYSAAKKAGFNFSKYRLVPFGNVSYIKVLADGKELPLYCSGSLRFRWEGRLNAAMVAFLECMIELQRFLERSIFHRPIYLPYLVDGTTLIDANAKQGFSIKMQLNNDEEWTKAMKFLLSNLKWLIAWVASEAGKESLEGRH